MDPIEKYKSKSKSKSKSINLFQSDLFTCKACSGGISARYTRVTLKDSSLLNMPDSGWMPNMSSSVEFWKICNSIKVSFWYPNFWHPNPSLNFGFVAFGFRFFHGVFCVEYPKSSKFRFLGTQIFGRFKIIFENC